MATLTFRLPKTLKKELDDWIEHAHGHHGLHKHPYLRTTRSAIIRRAITNILRRNVPTPKKPR
jgi:metal-responsive CopG/Arc/MetJ family transcriptional regulator